MTDVTPALIDGEDVLTDDTHEVHSPYDRSLVGSVPVCGAAEIDRAVAVARARHREGALHAYERAEVLDRAAVLLSERLEDFARSIAAESAKPLKTARAETERALDTLRFSAAAARTTTGETVAFDASSAGVGKVGYVMRVPVGVLAAISPFNFPLNLVCHKIAPAIAAGCPVVLKPASATPLTALAIARLFHEAGLPPGWLNVVTCSGAAANHLVQHRDVAMVSFTGSPTVGWGIRAAVPHKRVGLELGNNAPVIIEPSADLARAAARIAAGGYSFAGQSCISVQRVYVARSVKERFVEALLDEVSNLTVGDPMDPATDVSALIAPKETSRVETWIGDAVSQGGVVLTGATRDDAGVLVPTVLDRLAPDMEVSRNEVFGPLVGLATYDDLDQAIELANDTRYGLQAGIFTAEVATAARRRAPTRLRRRARQRGADVPGGSDALRRRARLGQHPRRTGLRHRGDDRTPPRGAAGLTCCGAGVLQG